MLKKLKKLSVTALTLGIGLLITSNVFAASDTIIIHSGDLNPKGKLMYVGDNYIDAIHSLNESSINFYSKIRQSEAFIDSTIYKRTIADFQEVSTYDYYVDKDDDYYPEADWTGEAGAAYIMGSLTMVSE